VEISFRDFRPDDLTRLWELDQQCFSRGIAYSRVELMHYIRRHGAFTIVAESNGEIAGFSIGEALRCRGHVITIDVAEPFRRHGLGSRLMDAAEERFRQSGCEVSLLETAVNNMGAIAFYKRRGYVVLKTIPRYYNGHLDALLMGRKLTDKIPEAQQG
jgi:[ribosomal protein S18]-alanine N-acetyltransferase